MVGLIVARFGVQSPNEDVVSGTPLAVSYEEGTSQRPWVPDGISPSASGTYPGRDLRPFHHGSQAVPSGPRRNDTPCQATADLLADPPELHLRMCAFVRVGQNAGSEMDQVLGSITRKVCVVSPFLPRRYSRVTNLPAERERATCASASEPAW